MVSILSQLHQYVPTRSERQTITVPSTGDIEEVQADSLHRLLVGGDQLTSERIRGAQSLRKNSTTSTGRLDGFVPVSEDWHAKVCFLHVCFVMGRLIYFYVILCAYIGHMEEVFSKKNTFNEKGTLAQLQSLINRRNLPADPKQNVNAVEDFIQVLLAQHVGAHAVFSCKTALTLLLQVITKGNVVAATLEHFGMESITAQLPPQAVSDLVQASTATRKSITTVLFGKFLTELLTLVLRK